jgi:LmbE family N-acetylglucosaminyl deacetylase
MFLMFLVPAGAQAAAPAALAPWLSRDTRLLLFSPHPDDESLGAAGLVQRVLKAGGRVEVVFMTNGDGFPEGVEEEDHISHPTAKDYRRYGAERRLEALRAARRLGLSQHDVIFLGFPDGGLSSLCCKFLTGPQAYRSPFTLENCPPASEVIIPRTDYTGQDLTREIERLISCFQPNLIATTPPQDEHPDHRATYFFVNQALSDWNEKHHHLNPKVLGFLVHFGQWPLAQGAGTGSRLNPPAGFPSTGKNWVSLALTPEEAATKRRAILEYHSQMLVMGRYLLGFARSNELFLVEN